MTAPVVYGSNGKVPLGDSIGRGGEGTIYAIPNQPDSVAKIYSTLPVSRERAEKVSAMPSLLTPALAKLTAWPTDTLKNGNGQVVGFVMPRVNALDIHYVYGPADRQKKFPDSDWRLLVRAALNTARAFAVVHSEGHVVADINHGGVMVSPDATVKLIDCDSFQVTHGKKVYLCQVGVEEFTPPELQGEVLSGVHRTPNHDAFGLAVLIFRLLMLGRHPFAGRAASGPDLSIGEAIRQNKYAYAVDTKRTKMLAPPQAPPVLVAGMEVAHLWERAFSPQSSEASRRPTAEEWVHALLRVEANFAKCPLVSTHVYTVGLKSCPWCDIHAKTGATLFPGPNTAPAPGAQQPQVTFSLDAVWTQITQIQPPPPVKIPSPPSSAQPSPEVAEYLKKRKFFNATRFLLATAACLGITALQPSFFVIGLMAAGSVLAIMSGMGPTFDTKDLRLRRDTAFNRKHHLITELNRKAADDPFAAKLKELEDMRDNYANLPRRFERNKAAAISSIRSEQHRLHLQRHSIDMADLHGIGPAKKATLRSHGIRTAFDVNQNKILNIHGFGPSLTAELTVWRAQVEGTFRFDPATALTPDRLLSLQQNHLAYTRHVETELPNGPRQLTAIRDKMLRERAHLEQELALIVPQLAQLDADLRALSY